MRRGRDAEKQAAVDGHREAQASAERPEGRASAERAEGVPRGLRGAPAAVGAPPAMV